MASLRQIAFIDHPNVVFPLLSTVWAVPALSPTPSFIPLILLLTTLLVYTRMIVPRPHAQRTLVVTWLSVSVAASLSHLLPSLDALSSTFMSLFSLWIISSLSSAVALVAVLSDRMSLHMATPWAKITFFPAVWATTWQAVAYLSPVGYLATWTPVAGIDAYDWLRPLAGTWGLNWVVGASAVVGAEMVGAWFIGPEDGEPLLIDDIPTDVAPRKAEETASRGSRHTLLLGAGLLALTAPSFLFPVHPIHPVESTFETSTPLIVGCILPPPPREGEHTTALERFIDESKKHNGAKVLLWPEGALRFENPTQRDEAFELVRKRIVGPLVGVTYEEPIPGNAHGKWRTGLTLVGPQGPVAGYFKRNLVPIAESFSLAPSLEPPSIYELKLSAPKGRRLEWAPNTPDNTRDIPLTSSICLDFATPSPFSALATRPALVLAPARTWHRDVGRAMWEQARARAEELGSAVLFCDGGAGGLSGVAGHGAREPMQEGAGSWTRAIGVEWPVVQRRTPYAWGGDGAVLVAVWAILGVGSVGEAVVGGLLGRRGREGEGLTVVRRVREAVSRLSGLVRSWRRPPQGEEQPLLF